MNEMLTKHYLEFRDGKLNVQKIMKDFGIEKDGGKIAEAYLDALKEIVNLEDDAAGEDI